MLINDHDVATHLLVDDALLKASGGIRGLNQGRVTITGERASEASEAVRVRSIKLEMKEE